MWTWIGAIISIGILFFISTLPRDASNEEAARFLVLAIWVLAVVHIYVRRISNEIQSLKEHLSELVSELERTRDR